MSILASGRYQLRCLGWCGGKIIISNDPARRYCPVCRKIKESRERGLSSLKAPDGFRWNGDHVFSEK